VRLLLIVNPTASSVTDRTRAVVEQRLGAVYNLTVEETEKRGHATTLAADAADAAFDTVVVLGGDGTLNEAAEGLAGTTTALAPLPGGSTNVFARTLGVSYDPATAADDVLSSIGHGSRRRVGLGVANGRRFLFHLGAGFDAAVVSEVELRPQVKRHHLAHPVFALAAFDTWVRRYDHRTSIEAELVGVNGVGAQHAGVGPYVVVSNSSPYTYVGRRRLDITPHASLDRPLALTIVRTMRADVMIRASMSAIANGHYLAHSGNVVQVADIEHLRLTARRPFPWQVDGDYLGETDALDVRYEPEALTVLVPVR
jgi:diacylglycerol kinase family enzyme